jgi:hypothetical protein
LVLMSLDRLRRTLEKGEAWPAQQSANLGRETAESFSAIPDLPIAPTPPGLSPITRERKEPERRPVERIEPVAAPLLRDADSKPELRNSELPKSEPPPLAAELPPDFAPASEPETPKPAVQVRQFPRAASAFAEAAAKAQADASPRIDELWPRVAVDLDAPKRDVDAPKRNDETAPATKSDDWLDRALGKLDSTPAPAPGHSETAEEAPPLAPDTAQDPQPEIIGRYEAEGTVYLMFADGTIEAQSEQGLLRFNSMAELKAFLQA